MGQVSRLRVAGANKSKVTTKPTKNSQKANKPKKQRKEHAFLSPEDRAEAVAILRRNNPAELGYPGSRWHYRGAKKMMQDLYGAVYTNSGMYMLFKEAGLVFNDSLSPAEEAALNEILAKSPYDYGYETAIQNRHWTILKLKRVCREVYGVTLGTAALKAALSERQIDVSPASILSLGQLQLIAETISSPATEHGFDLPIWSAGRLVVMVEEKTGIRWRSAPSLVRYLRREGVDVPKIPKGRPFTKNVVRPDLGQRPVGSLVSVFPDGNQLATPVPEDAVRSVPGPGQAPSQSAEPLDGPAWRELPKGA